MIISNKTSRTIVLLLIAALCFFQVQKRNIQKKILEEKHQALKATNHPLSKVLFQLPIYRDTVYKVYLVNTNAQNKLVFLRKGNLTNKQRESSFFVHIYPKNKKRLDNGINHIPNNFKNNVTSFVFNNENYFVSETSLPNIKISKLNLGQFGFRGDNSVSWKTSSLIEDEDMQRIVKENKEDVQLFSVDQVSF